MWCITAYACVRVRYLELTLISLIQGAKYHYWWTFVVYVNFLGEYSDSVCNSATKINEPECWSRFVRWQRQSLMAGATNTPTKNSFGTQARFWSQKIMLGVQQNNGNYEKASYSNPEFLTK